MKRYIKSASQSNYGKLYVLDDDAGTCILLSDGKNVYQNTCAPDGYFSDVDMYSGSPAEVGAKIGNRIKSGDIEDPESILIDPEAYGFKKLRGVTIDDIDGDIIPISASSSMRRNTAIKAAYNPNDVDAMEDMLYQYFKGSEIEFLTAVLQALTSDQKRDIYDSIIREYAVDYWMDM